MTREELEKTHPDYDALVGEWQFFIRSYFGGKIYKDGNYLIQHPFESTTNYKRRSEISYYYNYCAPIADLFVSHLFRKEAEKDFGSFSGDPLFTAFINDADLEGSSLKQFMREAQRFASVYGRVSIVVDKPKVTGLTVAEAKEHDLRPYLSLITPENLVDWHYTRLTSGKPVLESVKIKETETRYRIWTREAWWLWEKDKGSNEVVLLDSGEHNLGVVPVVTLYNKRSGRKMLGVSDIQDIADINKNIYYLCSDAKEIIENTAFPMLALPYEKVGAEEERLVGPRNILQFDPTEPGAKPYWLEAPHSSLTEIREWVKQDINEIHRIAKMGGVKATEERSARSGVALELEFQQLHATLSEKADNIEEAETEVLKLFARWQGSEFDGLIDYPDDFSVRDLDRDLDRVIKAISLPVSSVTLRRELQKKIARIAMPKLDEQTRQKITEEIEGANLGERDERPVS
ncbi:MAG: phage portal protein [Thermodesulfobacteriota bacterium]